MINSKVVELLQNPSLLRMEDLDLLQKEIQIKPYIQSLRALYLLGIHQFEPEKYQETLSETAAFTTDKKILYQFINGKIEESSFEEEIIEQEEEIENVIEVETPLIKEKVFVEQPIEAEQNENIVEEKPPIIKVEETETTPDISEFSDIETTAEKFEEVAKQEESLEESGNEINFHQSSDFLPKVKFASNQNKEEIRPKPSFSPNKNELEMQRLIDEVERKMKAKKEQSSISDEVNKPLEKEEQSSEISFAETQSFEVKSEMKSEKPKEVLLEKEEIVALPKEDLMKEDKSKEQEIVEEKSDWKPMNVQGNKPDSLIDKKTENTAEKQVAKNEVNEKQTEPRKENTTSEKQNESELPVMNVSFFSDKIETIQEKEEGKTAENVKVENEKSNVPNFINTWQNWLKIERTEDTSKEEIQEPIPENKKTAAIEKFIETEPKISQLKEENNFVVKEKKNDISHLMTETLANIYVEQKLYSKAIKAFKTLIQKHPEKEGYFKEKIKEVNELRS